MRFVFVRISYWQVAIHSFLRVITHHPLSEFTRGYRHAFSITIFWQTIFTHSVTQHWETEAYVPNSGGKKLHHLSLRHPHRDWGLFNSHLRTGCAILLLGMPLPLTASDGLGRALRPTMPWPVVLFGIGIPVLEYSCELLDTGILLLLLLPCTVGLT